MANALFIGWGHAVRGRERQSLEMFDEALRYFGGLRQQGEIEAVEPVVLEQHGGELYGFVLLRGDPDQLARLRGSEDFVRLIQWADLVVERLGVVGAFVGDEIARLFATVRQQVDEVVR